MDTKLPRQKLPMSKKGKEWRQKTVDAIIDLSDFGNGIGSGKSAFRSDLQKCYDYYNGIVDDDDYTHVLRPYGKSRKNFPAKLHNYPIIKPIIDLLLGEKAKRPLNYSVVVVNDDVITKKTEALQGEILKNLYAHFINELNKLGVPTGQEEAEEPEPPQYIAEAFNRTYRDQRAIIGQQALDFIIPYCDVQRKLRKAWFHFLVSGMTITYRDVVNNEPYYECLNPLEVDYDKDPNVDFIEDGEWAVHRTISNPSSVIDFFYEDLTSAEIDQIEKPKNSNTESFFAYNYDSTDNFHSRERMVEVMRVFWKSRKQIGILTYVDEFDELQEMEVPEGYKPEEGELVDWFWINEVWEGYRIDGDIYKRVRPLPIQRNSLDNKSACKLPINGRKYSDINSANVSLIMLMIPYQLTYNIFKYRLENSIAKSKDIIAAFDINMIPNEWDMDKWMYYVDATGIAWVDYAKEGVKLNPTHQTVLDMSIKTIEAYVKLLDSLVLELERMTGVSRQRQGQMSQYDLKSVSEQSIIQSSHITEDLFTKFAEIEQRDLSALLDYSKAAWINGKVGSYVMPDFTTQYLSVDGLSHMETSYGIFVTDAYKEVQKIQIVQQLTQAMVQNGTPISAIVDIIDANSLAIIKDKIRNAEEQAAQLAQAQQEAEMEAMQAQMQAREMEIQNENEQNQLDRENKLQIALINAENQRAISEANRESGIPDDSQSNELDRKALEIKKTEISKKYALEKEKLNKQHQSTKRALDLQESKQKDDKVLKEKEIAVKRIAANKKPAGATRK
jgi:hypothetical protein